MAFRGSKKVKVPTVSEVNEVLDVLSTLDEESRKIVEECCEKEEEEEEEEEEDVEQKPDWVEAEEELKEEDGEGTQEPIDMDVALANLLRADNENEANLLRRGGLKENIRTLPRWSLQDIQSSDTRRPAANKEFERDFVDESTQLTKLGGGVIWRATRRRRNHKKGPIKDPSMEDLEVIVKELEPDLLWMMYGSPRGLDVWSDIAFKEDLRSLEPEELAKNPVFWREFARAASVLEVTLVVRTCQDMTASQLPTRLVGGLVRAIEKQEDTPETREAAGDLGMFIKDLQGSAPLDDCSAVGRLVRWLPDPVQRAVRRIPQVQLTQKMMVPAGTTFVFAPRRRGEGMTVEAIKPGKGQRQEAWMAAQTTSSILLNAFLSLFVGPASSVVTRSNLADGILAAIQEIRGTNNVEIKEEDPFKTGPFLTADAEKKRRAY